MIIRNRILLFLKGMAMGAADSVPGVSGGSMAMITNIYEELIDAIKAVGPGVLQTWRKEGFGAAWREINGSFLLTLLLGILSAVFLLSRVILVVMDSYLPFLLAFFFGLVLASTYFVTRQVKLWGFSALCLFTAGIALAILLATLPLADSSDNLLYYFFCGSVAICAMILPGISGAFILLLLGVYGPVLEALTGFDWQVITVFGAGCVVGLMLFSRVLSWLLHTYHDLTLSALIGLHVGSLYLLWPWRVATKLNLNSHAFIRYQHVLPREYARLTGEAVSPLLVLLVVTVGAALVLALGFVVGPVKRSKQKDPEEEV